MKAFYSPFSLLFFSLLSFSAMAGHERTPISQIEGTGAGEFSGQISSGQFRWYSFWANAGDTITIKAQFNGTSVAGGQSQLTFYRANDDGLVEVGDSWEGLRPGGTIGTGLEFITVNYGSGATFGSNSIVHVTPFTSHFALMVHVSNEITDPRYTLTISGPTGSQEIRNTFSLISGSYTWHQAKTNAEARGGHLATITSQSEFDYVLSSGLPFSQVDSYWLGATDESQEGTWLWVTGEPWLGTFWASGEPNNQGGESYLSAGLSADHRWNDWGQSQSVRPQYLLEFEHLPCTPRKAKALAQVVNGAVVGTIITDGGCGYTNPPAVLIKGGGGTGAQAQATIEDGRVVSIQVWDAGTGYTNSPVVLIGSPPFVPSVSINVTRISVTQNVVLGWKYVLESSTNNVDWVETGPAFIADSEPVVAEFPVEGTKRTFRLKVVP